MINKKAYKIMVIGFLLTALLSSSVVSAVLDIEVEVDSGVARDMIFESTRLAQSFEPTVDTITSVSLYLQRSSGTSGDYKVSICSSSGGVPGTVLWSQTTAISDIAVITSKDWETFSCSVSVTPGSTYFLMAQVMEDQPCGMECNHVDWLLNWSNPYSDGVVYESDDNGSTWDTYSSNDFCFRVYGNLPPNEDPTACFSYSTSGLEVDVDAGCSNDDDGTIVSWQWDWTSDGSYDSTGETASHTYSSSNTYTIKLRVVDNDGGSDTVEHTVTVSSGGGGNTAPDAYFVATTSGLTVNVNAGESSDSDGTITNYAWDWTNDGSYDTSSASATTSHTYTSADTYTIKLRVTDNGSATDTYTRSVTVPASSGSSGFTTSNNTMYYLLAGVAAAVVIALVIYYGPTRKGKRNTKKPRR